MNTASVSGDGDSTSRPGEVRVVGRTKRLLRHLGLVQHQPDATRLATDVASLRAWVNAHKDLGPDESCLEAWVAEDLCREKSWFQRLLTPWWHRKKRSGVVLRGRISFVHFEILLPPTLLAYRSLAGATADVESSRERVNAHKVAGPDTKLRFQICLDYLTLARDAANANDVASGYEYLNIAEREAVFLMTRMERKVRAQSLRTEARNTDKFRNSWRIQAILSLLEAGRADNSTGTIAAERDIDVLPEALAEAVAHRNTLDRNSHRKTDKVRWQLAWLGFIVGSLVLIALAFVIRCPLPTDPNKMNLLAYGIYLGLLGGFVSSAITQRTADRKARVPEIEVSFYAALARGFLGAATSIPVYLLVKAGLITVGNTESSFTWGLLLLCFLAGFSERWFLNAVTSVAPEDRREDKPRVGSRQ